MPSPILEICDVKKVYFGKKGAIHKALDGVTFTLYEGEVLALLGVNGAGKTTLSGILSSLHPPSSGQVLWRGKPITEQLIPYRKIIGLCPQHPNIDMQLTLEENLLYAGRFYSLSKSQAKARSAELMERFKLTQYSQGKAYILSGGYKQRFLIARTLMHSPRLVILDEPTVGLDPHARHELWKVIRTIREEGVTVILTTHYLEEAEALANRVCIIDGGKIQAIDTLAAIKSSYNKEKLEDVLLAIAAASLESKPLE
ncbi:MAG: ABC transporter ATP-binding protein [Parachlamydiales bacterium]